MCQSGAHFNLSFIFFREKLRKKFTNGKVDLMKLFNDTLLLVKPFFSSFGVRVCKAKFSEDLQDLIVKFEKVNLHFFYALTC